MSNKTRKKQLKQIENQTQQGRSMVEMLGVLAIIGVISIGGIAGYRMAMNRYQANQIANEINLMRTDAKMKVARGVELLLGEPYDGEDGHLNFNANYGVKVESKDIFDEETSTTETSYSFTLFGIPAGVCKPLATLLDGMDDTAVLEINGGDYTTTENLCSETENEVMVAFSTKEIGGVSSGSDNPEVTDPEQADQPQDDDPVPEVCPKGTTLSDDKGECTCEEDEKTCNGGCCAGCEGGKVWNGKKCACPSGAEKSGEDGEECACSTATPYWDGTKCTACPEGSKAEGGKCVCNNDSTKEWKASLENGGCDKERVGECESNSDCGLGEYCYMYYGNDCTQEFKTDKFGVGINDSNKSQCKKAKSDINTSGDTNSKYILSTKDMTWWSAERFCNALGKHMVKISDLNCCNTSLGGTMTGTCYAKKEEGTCSSSNGLSDEIKALRKAENGTEASGKHSYWLYDLYTSTTADRNSCSAYYVYLNYGNVFYFNRNSYVYALCE